MTLYSLSGTFTNEEKTEGKSESKRESEFMGLNRMKIVERIRSNVEIVKLDRIV